MHVVCLQRLRGGCPCSKSPVTVLVAHGQPHSSPKMALLRLLPASFKHERIVSARPHRRLMLSKRVRSTFARHGTRQRRPPSPPQGFSAQRMESFNVTSPTPPTRPARPDPHQLSTSAPLLTLLVAFGRAFASASANPPSTTDYVAEYLSRARPASIYYLANDQFLGHGRVSHVVAMHQRHDHHLSTTAAAAASTTISTLPRPLDRQLATSSSTPAYNHDPPSPSHRPL